MENIQENTMDKADETGALKKDKVQWFDSLLLKVFPQRKTRTAILFSVTVISIVAALFLLVLSVLYVGPALHEKPYITNEIVTDSLPDASVKKQLTLVQKEVEKLTKRYNSFTPGLSYIVINTADNRFSLYSNKKLIREGFCSTGKLTLLKTESGDKEWVFRTPRGERKIQGKITKPMWSKPDWAFIEEGLPVPPKGDPSRFEYGVLGDYGLSIGNGYLIHGTIYQRFIGMPVTHGCVRLGDDDLKVVYNTLNIGSKVYIF